jgi:hypothetical protein
MHIAEAITTRFSDNERFGYRSTKLFQPNSRLKVKAHTGQQFGTVSGAQARSSFTPVGWDATFMSKPFSGQSGNGMHIHLSLYRVNQS